MMVIRQKIIIRTEVRAHPERLYVFGDNMARRGYGGQAGEMRGESNAIGVPTKWRGERDDGAYFTNDDWLNGDVRTAICDAFAQIEEALNEGRDVVIPSDGLGTGLAELPQRAPKLHAWIENRIAYLETKI